MKNIFFQGDKLKILTFQDVFSRLKTQSSKNVLFSKDFIVNKLHTNKYFTLIVLNYDNRYDEHVIKCIHVKCYCQLYLIDGQKPLEHSKAG